MGHEIVGASVTPLDSTGGMGGPYEAPIDEQADQVAD
jgi:hypothetical protein